MHQAPFQYATTSREYHQAAAIRDLSCSDSMGKLSWTGLILLEHPSFANVPPPLFQKDPDSLVMKISK